MNSNDIVGLVAIIGVIVIPSLGLTARFALKPIVDSVLRIREAMDRQRTNTVEDPRVTQLQQEVFELRDTVDRLATAIDFDRQLHAGTKPNALAAAQHEAVPAERA